MSTDDAIDDVYMKIQFPTPVQDFHISLPMEAETTAAGRVGMQVWESGRNAQGQCAVIQAAVNNNTEVQSAVVGNMISVHASKLPPKTRIMGMAAMTDNKSNSNFIQFTEGAYEYALVGQNVDLSNWSTEELLMESKSTRSN